LKIQQKRKKKKKKKKKKTEMDATQQLGDNARQTRDASIVSPTQPRSGEKRQEKVSAILNAISNGPKNTNKKKKKKKKDKLRKCNLD
jgi:hypothetical protein